MPTQMSAHLHMYTHTITHRHTFLSSQTLPRTALERVPRCPRPSFPRHPKGPLCLPGSQLGPEVRVPAQDSPGMCASWGGRSCPGAPSGPAGLWVSWKPPLPGPSRAHRPQARPGFRSRRHLGRLHRTWFPSAACLDAQCLVKA